MIEGRNLGKVFGKLEAVKQLDISVQKGEIYGFLGENGAGKTTTIRMLLGLIWPDSGEASLNGIPVVPGSGKALAGVGAILDEPRFYSHLSARKNLLLFSRLSGGAKRKRVDEALELLGLEGMANKAAGALSHGQRQRLGIAQALLPDNRLLLLDEPQNGLDPHWIQRTRHLLRSLKSQGITVLISSHRLNEIEQVCDRVGIIHRGEMLYEGQVQPLLEMAEWVTVQLENGETDRAEGLLKDKGFEVESHTDKLRVKASDDRLAAEINRLLIEQGFPVCSLERPRVSLEQVFLQLTGGE